MLVFYTVTIYLQKYEAFRCDRKQRHHHHQGQVHAKKHMSNRLLWWEKDAGHIDYMMGLPNVSKGFSKKVTFILRPEGWVKFSQVEKVGNS